MGFDAGAVFATLGGKFEPEGFVQYGRAMETSRRRMEDFEKRQAAVTERSKRVGNALKTTGAIAGGAVVAGVAAAGFEFVRAANKAASFEASMRNVNSIAKVSDRTLDSLSKRVLVLAAQTGQKPTALAEGLYDVVSSGFKANDALKIVAAGAKSANAGLTDAATSTKAITAVLNAYQLPASKAGQASDQLFKIVDQGVITFEELARQIGDVLPFSSQLKVPLTNVGGAIATITKNGVPAAQAMTQVKGIFNQMLSPSTALSKAIDKTGYSSAESLLKARGFQGALNALSKTTDGSKSAMSKLFPDVEALSGALQLTGSNSKRAAKDLEAMKHATGATGSALAEQSKSYDYAKHRFSAALEAAEITIGKAALPPLTHKLTEWADDLAGAIQDGRVDKFGHDISGLADDLMDFAKNAAQVAPTVVHAIGDVGTGIESVVTTAKHGISDLLGVYTTMLDGFAAFGKASNWLPGPDIDVGKIERERDKLNAFRDQLDGKTVTVPVKVTVDQGNARSALTALGNAKIKSKVVRILASSDDARSKIKQIVALGIAPKTAKVIAKTESAQAAVLATKALLLGVPASKVSKLIGETHGAAEVRALRGMVDGARSKTVDLTVRTHRVGGQGRADTTHASGRGPTGSEDAVIGEGSNWQGAKEHVVNPAHGYAYSVLGPTVASLLPGDYVIPTEQRFRGRALGLLADVAKDLGVQAFARGRKAKHKRADPSKTSGRVLDPNAKVPPVPKRYEYPSVDEDALGKQVDSERETYQKRRSTIKSQRAKVAKAREAVAKAKGKKAKREARVAHRDAEALLRTLQYGGTLASGQKISSEQELRDKWKQDSQKLRTLHAANLKIGRLNTRQDALATVMTNAAKDAESAIKKKDPAAYRAAQAAYSKAQADRQGVLDQLRDIYATAQKDATPNTQVAADIENTLATIAGNLQDAAQTFEDAAGNDAADQAQQDAQQAAQDAADRFADTGMTDADTKHESELQRDVSLAALTKDTGDDTAAATALQDFLQSIFDRDQGGYLFQDTTAASASAIGDLADKIKQARDNVTSLTTPGATAQNDNSDLQARLDQATAQRDQARQEADFNARALAASPTSSGGRSPTTEYHFHSTVPATAEQMRKVADIATGGLGLQPSRRSPRVTVTI